jgi:glycerol transport system ATP-binding protein
MARIDLRNLAHSYKPDPGPASDWALKSMTMTWEDGGAYALLGPSGCGKTTLLNIISGLVIPSKGQVFFGDADVTALAPERRNIAQVFQFPVIYDTMTVYQNLAFPLRNRKVNASRTDARVREVARMLDLTQDLERKARGLTADMKQKISLGRGLVREDVGAVLFDEPLTVIDPHLKWQLRGELKRVHRQSKTTMVYVTHDQTEALTFADWVVVMYEGEVVQVGTAQQLFEAPAHTFVGYFIGSPGMNVLPAEIIGNRARVAGQEIMLSRSYQRFDSTQSCEVGIRPEFLRIAAGGEGIRAKVRRVEEAGRHRIVRAEIGGQVVCALARENETIPEGDIRLAAEPQHVHVYANGHLVRT